MSHLGEETLVQGTGALLLENSVDSGPCPVILGNLSGNLGRVLDTALDDVHGRVEDGSDGTADGTRNQVIGHLALLGAGLGEHLADLEDAAKVAGVPENVSPHGTFQALVHGQDALILDRLDNAVNHAIVLSGRGLVLKANLDKLEGHDDEGLGSTGSSPGQNGQRLVHLVHAKGLAVELAPFVVGSEFGSALGCLHENRCRDSSVQTRKAGEPAVRRCHGTATKIGQKKNPPFHTRLTLHV